MKTKAKLLNPKNPMKFFLFLALILSIASCKKDKDKPEENPLETYISKSGFNTTSNLINAGYYEFGLEFSPNVNGKINAITAQLPAINNNLRVTIWDFDSKAVLKTETINVSAASTLVRKDITAFELQKDKKYFISMNSNHWYNRTKPGGGSTTYPIISGNITFHSYLWKSGTTQTFPTNIDDTYYAGDLGFVFQQTK